jgi:23S rRNA (uracil1939-C5)-methyltransferase
VTEQGTFVSYAAPGDLVEIEAEGKRATLLKVVEASADRVVPPCIHFGTCGACQTQHIAHEAYRSWKHALVKRALEAAGIQAEVAPLVDAHGEGRRRVTLALKHGVAGYHRRGSHEVMPASMCPILSPGLSGALGFAQALATEMPEKWLSLLITATEAGMDADLKGPLHGNARLNARLASIAREHGVARLTAEREPLALFRPPRIGLGAVATAMLPPGAFLQATARGEEVLAGLVLDGVKRARRVADLFCGIGPFAVRLAARAQVYAADSDADAVASLRKTAAVPGLKPVNAERRDLFRRPLAAIELEPFDAVVFDPAFDGAAAQSAELARSQVPRIVAVSCNPQTFARDAAVLIGGGYALTRVTPVDQFLFSPHVELVATFER